MESDQIPKHQMELFKKEKQVFPNCIQAVRQYSNKRKSSMRFRFHESPRKSDENVYPALTSKHPEQRSTEKVSEWLQKCEKIMPRPRLPFADLEPNIPSPRVDEKHARPKMSLRSSVADHDIENKTKLFSKDKKNSPKLKLTIGEIKKKHSKPSKNLKSININKKGNNKSKKAKDNFRFSDSKNITDETVLSISRCSSLSFGKPATIEDSPETYEDKDRLACLAVIRADEQAQASQAQALEAQESQGNTLQASTLQEEVLQADGMQLYLSSAESLLDNAHEVGTPLQENIWQFGPLYPNVAQRMMIAMGHLEKELNQQEEQGTAPAFLSSSGHEMIWSSRALMKHLCAYDKDETITKINKVTNTQQLKKHSHLQSIIKARSSKKGRLPYLRAFTKNIMIKKCRTKPRRNKFVQTDFTCTCTGEVSANKKNESFNFGGNHVPFKSQYNGVMRLLKDCSNTPVNHEEILSLDQRKGTNLLSENLFTEECLMNLHESVTIQSKQHVNYRGFDSGNEMEDVQKLDPVERAHNESGHHTVCVLVHAPMQTPPQTDPDSVIEATLENLQRTPPRLSRSSSPVLGEECNHQTPPRSLAAVSPTFTSPTSNISNSSSNKENYDPNATPLKHSKKLEDCKGKESTDRAPFGVLFETSHIRVACSCLQPVQEALVVLACQRLGWTYCQEFKPDITHLVVAVDDDNRAQRTVKYMCSLAAGCWVVAYRWAVQSLTHECHQDEDEYEVVDWSGEDGPRMARMTHTKLFAGLSFRCLDTITTIRKDILTWMVETAGGSVVTAETEEEEGLELIITLHEPVEEEMVHNFAEPVTSGVVLNYEWLVESLGRYRLQPPDLFLLHAATPRALTRLRGRCSDRLL